MILSVFIEGSSSNLMAKVIEFRNLENTCIYTEFTARASSIKIYTELRSKPNILLPPFSRVSAPLNEQSLSIYLTFLTERVLPIK